MPWKGEKDAYKIWISEVILQQTRVEQGLGYYNRFIAKFPDVHALAAAPDEVVFKVWEGLGYYSRCKNLLASARILVANNGGKFPSTYAEIIQLKGIGVYTAAAISSFAYGLPHAVVDGNVLRVLSRYFGENIPIDSTKGKQLFSVLASELLAPQQPAAYNQAIMDFGATVCTPQSPDCEHCVLQSQCVAYRKGIVYQLPVKEKKLVKRSRFFTYYIFVVDNDKVMIRKRTSKDVWQNLFEFYLIETSDEPDLKNGALKKWLENDLEILQYSVSNLSAIYKQQLTHQHIRGRFVTIHLGHVPASLKHMQALPVKGLSKFAFPRLINHYLENDTFTSVIANAVKQSPAP